jgi:hypothetical protein
MSRTPPCLGLPLAAICSLALLAVPRVVAHDLDLVGEAVNLVLVFAPPVIWVAVVLARRVPNPLLTLGAVGLCYGLLAAITHQILWNRALDEEPRLGGNLADLPDTAQTAIMRGFAAGSSIVTGIVVGLIAGAVATVIQRTRTKASH